MGPVTIELTDAELRLLEGCVWRILRLQFRLPSDRRARYCLALERLHERLSRLVHAQPALEARGE